MAIHDALVAGADGRRGRLVSDAVAAGAAWAVLEYLFPADAGRIAALAAERSGPGGPDGAAARGFALGRAVGALVVEHGRQDGSDAPFTGPIPTGPGIWTGTDPVLPMCGTWRCWIIESGDAVQPEPPYAYGSPEDLADVEAVRLAALRRTPEQVAAVHRWADRSPPAIWNGTLREMVAGRSPDPVASARAFAYLNAVFDGFVSCWGTKYQYWTARPFQRIPGLVTVIPTPNFPSYTSGHSTISAAAAEVLAELFPERGRLLPRRGGRGRDLTLWGGIHFPHDNQQGLEVGRAIGANVVEAMRGAGAPHRLARR